MTIEPDELELILKLYLARINSIEERLDELESKNREFKYIVWAVVLVCAIFLVAFCKNLR